jgi:hypothetical protein
MGLALTGVPHKKGGVDAAMDYLLHSEVGRGAAKARAA